MKTVKDLNELIPTIIEMVLDDPDVGTSYWEKDEEGFACRVSEPEYNSIVYEKDGWYIEVNYEVSGEWSNDPGDYWTPPSSDLERCFGEVTEIFATYTDEETDEEYDFTDEELDVMVNEINKALEDF